MLETEEVDIDYFTPASSTSLARIFNSTQDSGQDATLKYVPPQPLQGTVKPEVTKPTQCVYASAFHVYEWCNNTHVPKGKLGFAIMKITQSGIHNMVIYNSEKITFSCLSLNPDVTLNIDRDHRISYYDSSRRYWSIYTTQSELHKIIDVIKPLNVELKYSTQCVEETPNQIVSEDIEHSSVKNASEDRESDTDSSIVNKRTKETILKRMATMGQSVLPQPQKNTFQTSDSSDTNDSTNLPKIRHKPMKINSKKHVEKKINEDDSKSDTSIKITAVTPISQKDNNILTTNEQQIVPIRTYDVQSSTSINEYNMNLYISEQRVTNSEMRMNMNKMADKLDVILDKVKDQRITEPYQQNTSSFQNDIVSKLLGEYEIKIKRYEEFLKLKGFDCCSFELSTPSSKEQKETKVFDEQHFNLICIEKDNEISKLRDEVQRLSAKCEQNGQIKNDAEIVMTQEISNLKQELFNKNEQIFNLTKKLNDSNESEIDFFKSKLKEVMNDTFQTIAINFDNNETYSGTQIKNTVASVIKKTTMNALINK